MITKNSVLNVPHVAIFFENNIFKVKRTVFQ